MLFPGKLKGISRLPKGFHEEGRKYFGRQFLGQYDRTFNYEVQVPVIHIRSFVGMLCNVSNITLKQFLVFMCSYCFQMYFSHHEGL